MDIYPVKENKNDDKLNIKQGGLPDSHFLGILIGGVKSGKTTVLINLVYQCFKQAFDEIIFFSPNVWNDKIFDSNISKDDDITKISNLDNVDETVKEIVDHQQEIDKKDRKNLIMIFDDVVGYIGRSFLTYFTTRYRQLKISLVFSVQAFRSLPNIIRANSSFMIIFKTYNKKELEKIFDELGHIRDIEYYYENATKEKYNFMLVDLRNIKIYKCLKEVLYDRNLEYK